MNDDINQQSSGTISGQAAGEEAIHNLFGQMCASWDAGDSDAYAAQFTNDADYIVFDGTHLKGREAIAAVHRQLFTFMKGSSLKGQITEIRFLSPDIALVYATGAILLPGDTEIQPDRKSIQTMVATKQNDHWLFTAFQNTRITANR